MPPEAQQPGSQLTKTKDDPRLRGIIRRHLHFYPVSDDQANKALTHFPRNMGQNLVPAGKCYLEHRSS